MALVYSCCFLLPQGMLGATSGMRDEPTAATVMTLESTQISVCSFGSMVSKGRFQGQSENDSFGVNHFERFLDLFEMSDQS